jgi:hypothetical protein
MNILDHLTRRELLQRSGLGFGLLGLAATLDAAPASVTPLAPKAPQVRAKAKQVVHLFMNGGPSQVDTFDPKPLLGRYHGKPLPNPNLRTERKTAGAMRSPFKFQRYGKAGIEVSELFHLTASKHIDDMCILRSMVAEVPNHEPSLMLMNCGDGRLPRPSMGAWITYGLGSQNQNLPGFLALCPGGYPIVATQNWRAAFLPGTYQGTYVDTQHEDVRKLIENIHNSALPPEEQRRQLDLVLKLNRMHSGQRPNDPQLEARIQSLELAYRMQAEATDAFDVKKEPKHVRDLYGSGIHARQLMITRRLLERGVRFIQVWSGAGQPWDNHDGLEKQHKSLAQSWDQAIAGFLTDLKQRGLFDTTLVMWGGEFGRTPVAELPGLSGRDHNHYGFSMWLAGGGVKGGHVHGSTDELGFAAATDKVHVHDLHATILHLLGFDHEKLTYRYAGRDFRLTDVHGQVVKEVLA